MSESLEIRLHGRGGQGGVTCAKIVAAVYAQLGKSVQTFGDYSGERSGAPVRAYTRVSNTPIENRNKVYQPDHLIVLDPSLLSDDTVTGLAPGGTLLINTPQEPQAFAERFAPFRVATVDATQIARSNKIGTRSVVIVNTTIAGAFCRALGLPLEALQHVYGKLGLLSNLPAAKEAYEQVRVHEAHAKAARTGAGAVALSNVLPLEAHREGAPTGLKTGSWRSQAPQYVTQLAPCNAFCPAGNDVVGFVQALAKEGEAAAAAVLRKTTPFPGVCGRVCPAPCMEGCNRAELDGAVNIRALERWISDHVAPEATRPTPAQSAKRFAIVGSGPAGLSAAYSLARWGHRVVLLEAERALGGVLRTGIPTYRLPREVLDREIDAILSLGVEVRLGQKIDAAAVQALGKEFDAVLLATGLARLRRADGPNTALPGIEQGIDFLHRLNLEGTAAPKGHVVVLGGGNTAMDCARSAVRAGASKVTVVYRRSRAEMPAIPEEIEHAADEGVDFVMLRAPIGFYGEGKVEGVELAEVELGPPDSAGRRSPIVTERKSRMACDTVLLALGQSAELSILPKGLELSDGRVLSGGAPTNLFACGDLATSEGTVTHAIGSGRRAAARALRALGVEVEEFVRPDRSLAVAATDIRFDHFERAAPEQGRLLEAGSRKSNFKEVDAGLASKLEAHRCFSCGHCTKCDTCMVYCPEGIIHRADGGYEIDYAYCKGCGICVTECPRRSMEMTLP